MGESDFYAGMKVSMNGEFGVVTNEATDWSGVYFIGEVEYKSKPVKLFGLIRWDTNKEKDYEDWRGLYGAFIEAGGFVLPQDYTFQFINDDGVYKASK